MGALKLEKLHYTFEEYLELEEKALQKHEYHNGEILEMSGGSLEHGIIGGNVVTAVNNALDKTKKDCTATNSDVKIFIEKANHGVYADALMFCGDPEYYKNKRTVIKNPCLIIEVLSKSTKNYDKGQKFEKYRTLPSFREYMLIWQTIPKVQTWYKEANNLWRISSAFDLNASIHLYTVGQDIALQDIYKKVKNLGQVDDMDAF